MRFLFIGQGYPGISGTSSGSGIGTYLRSMVQGLLAKGHSCHVVLWSVDGQWHSFEKDGVLFRLVPHRYWPVLERILPDSRDMWNLLVTVWRLDRRFDYDRIEIQSEEGIANWVLRWFSRKTLLRIHTTLALMQEHKKIAQDRVGRFRVLREETGVRLARRVVTHSRSHADEMQRQYPFLRDIAVVPHGVGGGMQTADCSLRSEICILVVGSADLRKGFDRIRAVLDMYVQKHGACRCVIVSSATEEQKRKFGLLPPFADGLKVEWLSGISAEDLQQFYSQADVLLHLARYESFGLPLIETAAAGTPVVATPVGIAPELLADDLDFLMVDGDAPDDVVKAIRLAIEKRFMIGGVLRKRYEAQFTADIMVDEWLAKLA